ncbi:hypothetical protein EV421DRAFT_1688206, partial [Armillaria borealis]
YILRECPQFDQRRHILRSVSERLVISNPIRHAGMEAVTKVLTESGAFTKTGALRMELGMPRWENEPGPRKNDDIGW